MALLCYSRTGLLSSERGQQVTDIGDECYSRADANAKLQKSQPEWYGPYLDEGEKYLKPRDAENLAKAYEEMKLDDIPLKYAHLRPQIEELALIRSGGSVPSS